MIYRVQRVILLVFYTISMVALSIPLVSLLARISPGQLFPLVAGLLFYMVLVIVLGCLIHTISYIPFNLASEFDPVKNDISSGQIKGIEELSKRVCQFLTRFFDFAFLDIEYAFLHTEQAGLVSNIELPEADRAMKEFDMLEKSKTFREIQRAGKITLEEKDYHLYVLPVYLGDQWLGYLGLMSGRRIGRFFQKFLTEFEDNFLDDQLMHVIRNSQ